MKAALISSRPIYLENWNTIRPFYSPMVFVAQGSCTPLPLNLSTQYDRILQVRKANTRIIPHAVLRSVLRGHLLIKLVTEYVFEL